MYTFVCVCAFINIYACVGRACVRVVSASPHTRPPSTP